MTQPTDLTLPSPRLPDPAAVPPLRWGVIGTGIATRVVAAMHAHTPQRVVAWAGRDPGRTAATARAHGVERAVTDVRALVEDPDVDVVYVATPHPSHVGLALAAVAAGKHVLVEKPVALDAAGAAAVCEAARAAGVLAMEAMWTRYLPQTEVLRRVLADGLLGDVQLVRADFAVAAAYDAGSRLWDPALGGGALLDLGVYPVSLASMVLGPPTSVAATGTLAPTGVDASAHLVLGSAGGATALLSTSLTTSAPATAVVGGTAGHAVLADPFWGPSTLTVSVGGATGSFAHPDPSTGPSTGYAHQLTALAAYVAEGRVESPLHDHEETVAVLATLDEARRQLGAASGPATT